MKYPNITPATFIDRPNRFVATVSVGGAIETVHVKNTGRCKELLIPGAQVYLTAPGTAGRKTRYDLVAVRKGNGLLINIDSQAPNRAALTYVRRFGCGALKQIVLCDMTPKQLNDEEWKLGLYQGAYTNADMEREAGKKFYPLYKAFAVAAVPKLASREAAII